MKIKAVENDDGSLEVSAYELIEGSNPESWAYARYVVPVEFAKDPSRIGAAAAQCALELSKSFPSRHLSPSAIH